MDTACRTGGATRDEPARVTSARMPICVNRGGSLEATKSQPSAPRVRPRPISNSSFNQPDQSRPTDKPEPRFHRKHGEVEPADVLSASATVSADDHPINIQTISNAYQDYARMAFEEG